MKKAEERNREFMFMLRGIVDAISKKTMNTSQKPACVAMVLAIILLTYTPCLVLGASGGRMGGSSFRSSSSPSSSHSRRSTEYSTWHHSHHHHHYHHDRDPAPDSIDFISILLLGMCILVVIGLVFMWVSQVTSIIKLQVCLFGSVRSLQKDLDQIAECTDTSTPLGWNYILRKTTKALLKRQDSWFSARSSVCLFGATNSLQKDLDWIAESADTSGTLGWNYIVKETANTLLQYLDWCIAAHSSVDVKTSSTEGKTLFEKLSIEEHEKFDKETLVHLDNTKWNNTSRQSDNEVSSDYIVVTVLVVAKGTHILPSAESSADLKEALEKLYLISTEQTTAGQVLWAPQEENDTLSKQELHEKYPLLSVLSKSHAHEPENVSRDL